MQAPVAAGTGEGATLLPAGLLAGFLPVYLNQKGGCRTVFVQQPPFGWEIYHFDTPEHLRTLRRTIFTGKTSAPTGLSCCAG